MKTITIAVAIIAFNHILEYIYLVVYLIYVKFIHVRLYRIILSFAAFKAILAAIVVAILKLKPGLIG